MKSTPKKIFETILLSIFGLMIIVGAIISDILLNRPFRIGWAQILLIGFGLGVLVAAGLHFKGRLFLFFRGICNWFLRVVIYDGFPHKSGKILDGMIIFFFLLYAIAFFIGRWNGFNPVLVADKNGDAGALISYAVALDYPQFFNNDQSLHNVTKPSLAYGIFMPFIRTFGQITQNYGLGFLLMLPICISLQFTGFYLLGKELFKNRFWALALVLITSVPVYYLYWDFWGIVSDPLPRFAFQSMVPMFLWGFIRLKDNWRWWPGLFLLVFSTSFLHVISAPALAFMLWLGGWLYLPTEWKISHKVAFQALNGLVFFTPFAGFIWLSGTSGGFNTSNNQASYVEVMQYLNTNFSAFLHFDRALPYFISVLHDYGLLVIPLLAIPVIFFLKTQKALKTNLVLLWMAACLIISIVVPMVEHWIEQSLQIPPVQIDLVRNLRYTIPLIEILGLSGLVAFIRTHRLPALFKRFQWVVPVLASIAGILWLAIFINNYNRISPYEINYAVNTLNCLMNGHLFCSTDRERDEVDILNAIREKSSEHSTYIDLPNDELSNEIRYGGMRSVAFTKVDKNRVVYSQFKNALKYESIEQEWNQVKGSSEGTFASWIIKFSCETKVTHWLLDKEAFAKVGVFIWAENTIYENDTFLIIQAPACP